MAVPLAGEARDVRVYLNDLLVQAPMKASFTSIA
jgi:hypothetical protein